MTRKEIKTRTPIDASEDRKDKASGVLPLFDDFYSRFQLLFPNQLGARHDACDAGRQLPATCPPDSDASDPGVALELRSMNSNGAASYSEELKPWMALISGVPTLGSARDFGLQKIWDEGLRGKGVKINVDDTGLMRGHADFDYAKIDADGYFLPGEGDSALDYDHGTAVAGVIAARSNGLGTLGVANESALRITDYQSSQFSKVRNAIAAGCDILNLSWGVRVSQLLSQLDHRGYYDAMFSVASQGRNGLGITVVSGGGNSRKTGNDTAIEPTTNHENVIAVAGIDFISLVARGSTPGETLHVAALGENVAVLNAGDLSGASVFRKTGTSFAAPFVSGVVALMYQANAGLGLRDVQEILAYSAKLPVYGMSAGFRFNGGRHANGGGAHFSRDYGFGLVDAHQAVRLAQSWFVGGPAAKTGINREVAEMSNYIREGDHGQRFALKFTLGGTLEVEHVKLRLDLDVDDLKNVKFVLTSPQGTESVLMSHFGSEEARAFNNVIDLGSRRFWGENAAGEWTLNVLCDNALNDLRGATLIVSGTSDTQDDRYVYTNEFNYLAVIDRGRRVLEDSDGGDDTFNAASVTDDVVVDLAAGQFRFGNGPQGRIAEGTVIENVVGGDGNDTLSGSAGNDELAGGKGADVLSGRGGDDTYIVDDDFDLIVELAGEGADTVRSQRSHVLGANIENLILSGSGDIHGLGNALDNYIIGNDGNNQLDGGRGGKDTLIGGEGDDIYLVGFGDVVIEDADSGIDGVIADSHWTLENHIEGLLLVGSAPLSATGNALDNMLIGHRAGDVLCGADGNDLLKGGSGDHNLTSWVGTVLLNGGAGNDTLIGGLSAELHLGGRDDDRLQTGAGDDVILFNRGDGQDTVVSVVSVVSEGTARKTVSLGGEFSYSDLSFSKRGEHLVLKIGTVDQMTFEEWYALTPSRSVANLQVIAEAMSGFEAGGADPLCDQKVERFDFTGLVGAFDAARAATPTLSDWALSNALSGFLQNGSNEQALGGDLAYHYGRHGTLSGIGLSAAQTLLRSSAFGTQAQTLRPESELAGGGVWLA